MYLLYIDESGTSAIPGTTSHFILAGISVPIWHWKDCEREISSIKNKYNLDNAELHTGWLLRRYVEQDKIHNFSKLDIQQRSSAVLKSRRLTTNDLQKKGNKKKLGQVIKNYKKTAEYIHLTYEERKQFLLDIAAAISKWGFARLFAECIDKDFFASNPRQHDIDTQAFEQIVSRFERYLKNIGTSERPCYGLMIHDNNETVARKHTMLMKDFYKSGTLWTDVKSIIETPLFVDSSLTTMVQIADLCSYAIRRYLENDEEELFNYIYQRADRVGSDIVVGIRHFADQNHCSCKICANHKQSNF